MMNQYEIYFIICNFAEHSSYYKMILDNIDNLYKTDKLQYNSYMSYIETHINSEEDIEKFFNRSRNYNLPIGSWTEMRMEP